MSASFDNDLFLELAKKWPGTALQYLHKHFYHQLIHISQQRTNNREASKDIVQEVFIAVWRRMDRLTHRDGFLIAPYLLMLVKHKSITFYRKSAGTQNLAPAALDSLISSLPTAEDRLFTREAHRLLRALVETLPRRERECMRLRYFDGLSNEAVAGKLGVSKKTVERRLATGIRLLRKHLS